MNLTIHRGSKEIGGSCVEISHADSRIVIDVGLPLVDEKGDSLKQKPKDSILPVKGLFDEDGKKPDGLLISHAHMDHNGLLPKVGKDVTVYSGEGTRSLMDVSKPFLGFRFDTGRIKTFEQNKTFTVGKFKITPYLMDHSAFDSYAFLVEAEGKSVLYSGDFRIGGRKTGVFNKFLKDVPKGIDAVLLEGTTIGRKEAKYKNEKEVEKRIDGILESTSGALLVFCSGQNIDRIVSVFKAAVKNGRKLVIDVYTANVLKSLKHLSQVPQYHWKEVRVFCTQKWRNKLRLERNGHLINEVDTRFDLKCVSKYPKSYVALLKTSMGEEIRSMNLDGARAVWSMWHGYKEQEGTKKILDYLQDKGVEVEDVHFGGHVDIETLKKLVKTTNPKAVIPIHTMKPEDYGKYFENVKMLADGEEYKI